MSVDIRNFPAALQPIIQQGFLRREFQQAITSRLGYRAIAERRPISGAIGENGINHYAATTDLNMVTSRVGIASQFLLNAAINGEQAGRTMDELASIALRMAYQPSVFKAGPLTMATLLGAVATLRQNDVPEIDGVFNCYLEPVSAGQLFSDSDFRQLFTGATSANQVFRRGMVNEFLGLRFIPTPEYHIDLHSTKTGIFLRRPVVCGAGTLIEHDYTNMLGDDVAPIDALVEIVDDVAMVTREPIDRLHQIIAQSWYWIGKFEAQADDGAYRRAVIIEHEG